MKLNLSIYEPYSLYDVKYVFSDPKELSILEAIILTLIKFNNNSSLKLIDYLLDKLNLNDKYIDFILKILNEMNETQFKIEGNKIDKYTLLGEVKIIDDVSKSIDQNNFYGLKKEIKTKDKKFLWRIRNRNYIEELNHRAYKEGFSISQDLIKINKKNNDLVSEQLISWFHENNKEKLLKEYEIRNDLETNNNIIFLPINFEPEINIEEKQILIDKKEFYEIIDHSIQYQYIENVKSWINKQIELNFNFLKNLKNNDYSINKNFIKFQDYDQINKSLSKCLFNSESNIIFNHELIKINVLDDELIINNNDSLKINFPIIYYQKIDNKQLEELFNNNDINWLDIKKQITDDNQIEMIEKLILDDYIKNFNNNHYKSFILENIKKIKNLSGYWLLSDQVNDGEFEKIIKKYSKAEIIKIIDREKLDSKNKINILYKEHEISIFELETRFNEDIDRLNSLKKMIDNINIQSDIKEVSSLIEEMENEKKKSSINELAKIYSMNLEELMSMKEKITLRNKELIIEKILDLFNNHVKGHLDDYFKIKLKENELEYPKKDEFKESINLLFENKIISNDEKQLLDLLRRDRNDWGHSTNEKIKMKLEKLNLDELNNKLNEYKSAINIIRR